MTKFQLTTGTGLERWKIVELAWLQWHCPNPHCGRSFDIERLQAAASGAFVLPISAELQRPYRVSASYWRGRCLHCRADLFGSTIEFGKRGRGGLNTTTADDTLWIETDAGLPRCYRMERGAIVWRMERYGLSTSPADCHELGPYLTETGLSVQGYLNGLIVSIWDDICWINRWHF